MALAAVALQLGMECRTRAGFLEVRTIDEGDELRNILGTSGARVRCRSEASTFHDHASKGWQTGMEVAQCAVAAGHTCIDVPCSVDQDGLAGEKDLSGPICRNFMECFAEPDILSEESCHAGGDATPWISEDSTSVGHWTSENSMACVSWTSGDGTTCGTWTSEGGASYGPWTSEDGTTCFPGSSEEARPCAPWTSEETQTSFLREGAPPTSGRSRLCKAKRERVAKLAQSLVEKGGARVNEILSHGVPSNVQDDKFLMKLLRTKIKQILDKSSKNAAFSASPASCQPQFGQERGNKKQLQGRQQQQQTAGKRWPGY